MNKKTILLAILITIGIGNAMNNYAQELMGKWIIPTMITNPNHAYLTYELEFYCDGTIGYQNNLLAPSLNGSDYHSFSGGGYNENLGAEFYCIDKYLCYETNSPAWIDPMDGLEPEFQIIPKPATSGEYYTFFSRKSDHHAGWACYREVYVDPANGDVTYGGIQQLRTGDYDRGYSSFAITEEVNNARYIYNCSTEEDGVSIADLSRWTIDSYGISSQEIVLQAGGVLSNNQFDAYNLELSTTIVNNEEVNVFAWIHRDDGINDVQELIVLIDTYPTQIIKEINPGLGRIGGIEFSDCEENIVYLSTSTSGLVKINYMDYQQPSDVMSVPGAASNDFNHTYVQRAPDGHIYAVSNSGYTLGRLYQYEVHDGTDIWSAGEFNPSAFPFLGQVSTYRSLEPNTNYYILPENSKKHIPTLVAYNVGDVSCPGYSDGWIELCISGGAPPYTISCDPPVNFVYNEVTGCYEATGLGEGEYNYTVENSCNNIYTELLY